MKVNDDRRAYTENGQHPRANTWHLLAIRKGLDAIAAARSANGQSGLRHEIAHSNYVSDEDLSRFKALVGAKPSARNFENQQVEALVKCRVLNRMASLGLPLSERVLQD